MNQVDTMTESTTRPSGRDLPRELGFPGRVAVSWAMASGVLAGGVFLAVLTLLDRASAFGLFLTSTALFLGGSAFGFLHGAVLGWMGRASDMDGRAAGKSVGLALMYAIPGLGFSWVASSLVSQTVAARFTGNLTALGGVAVAWIAVAVICVWAAREGLRAFRNAFGRWEDTAVGTALTVLVFASFLSLFLADLPELWGTQLEVGTVGAVLLAGFVTTWLSGPAISLPLWLGRRLPEPRIVSPPFPEGSRLASGVGIALVVGGALGIVALWLAPSLATAPAVDVGVGVGDLLVLSVARALIDETVFRLFIVTSLAWVFRRWHPLHPEEAVTVAIGVAVMAQLLAYLPAYLAQGLPDAGALLQQVTWLTAAPAVAMGLLYVWRGLPAAFTGALVFHLVVGGLGA
jgi:hypothetical protein